MLSDIGKSINESKACPKRPNGVQVLGRSQMLLWNSFTPGRSKWCSSQQLGDENTEYFISQQEIQCGRGNSYVTAFKHLSLVVED